MPGTGRIVVTGLVGLYPASAGGVAWDYLQYVIGLRALGWDAIYLEDSQAWPIFQHGAIDGSANVAYLAQTMKRFDLADRWAYRDAVSGKLFGKSESELRDFLRTTDVFLNLSCSAPLRDEYAAIPVRALVDTDPMFTQIQYLSGESANHGPTAMRNMVHNHTHFFTLGERVGASDCRVPTLGLHWHPTRQPIVLDLWRASAPSRDGPFSTIMSWVVNDELEFDGERWGQKDVEFVRVIDVPSRVPSLRFEIAVGHPNDRRFPADAIRDAGWAVVDSAGCSADAQAYQAFIFHSRGEFSVAKETYVKAKTGWFSGRSACYLASGRPVVTQDTAWSHVLPTGRGLFAYSDVESAVDALREVEAHYEQHASAAREIAERYFDSAAVLGDMLAHMRS